MRSILGVAAGHVKRPHDVEPLLAVPDTILGSITLGSYTLEPRTGNEGSAYWCDGASRPTSINALGLPNPGMVEVDTFLYDTAKAIRDSGKQVRVSVAGFEPREYKLLAQKTMGIGPFVLELNLGCPNVRDGGSQKRITSFYPYLIQETLNQVYDVTDHVGAPMIAIKLSVYSDPRLLEEVAKLLSLNAHMVQTVVMCNTFSNATGYDEHGKPLISATDGYGGLAGAALKHIALGQVRAFRRLLPSTIDIVGVGGISTGRDVLDMVRAGASSVQVGTAYFDHEDPRVFTQIMTEYAELG